MKDYVIKRVQKATDWSEDVIRQSIEKAAGLGISQEEYLRFCCWEMSDGELQDLPALLEQVRARQRQDEDWLLNWAHRRTLRSMAVLRKELEAFKALGVSPYQYMLRGYYFPTRAKRGLQKEAKQAKRPAGKSHFFGDIQKVTGWSASKTEIETTKAWLNCGANYENYYRFRLDERSPQEQAECLTFEHYKKMTAGFNHYLTKGLLNGKSDFNRIFAAQIKRRWFINRDLSYAQFLKKIEGLDAIIVKPVNSTQGKGIQKLDCNVEDKKALYDEIMAYPKSVVEEYIIQHPDVAAFCKESVNTLRIVTLNAHGKCNVLFAIMRMGQGSFVDNVHAGGIAAAVDVKTGIISSDAVDSDGNRHAVHPISKLPIRGFQIPNWDAVLDMCQKCYKKIPGVRLVGWDVAITPDGVDLIEGNSSPGFTTIQATALQDGKGLRAEVFDPYI